MQQSDIEAAPKQADLTVGWFATGNKSTHYFDQKNRPDVTHINGDDPIRTLSPRYANNYTLSREEIEQKNIMYGMADCMDMVRTSFIEMGIIDKTVPPMFVVEAVCAYMKKVVADASSDVSRLNFLDDLASRTNGGWLISNDEKQGIAIELTHENNKMSIRNAIDAAKPFI